MNKQKFKILSIDGGGIRGIIPCRILQFIEEQTGPVSNNFDLIAGTSTGGIVALGLSKQDKDGLPAFSAKKMLGLYENHGNQIFQKRQKDFFTVLSKVTKLTKELFAKPFTSKPIEDLLAEYFGDAKLAEALTNVIVTTYDMQTGKPFYFSSRLAKGEEKENYNLKEIARSTSAAPTYFEPNFIKYDMQQDVAFIDGGVYANNPSLLAYAEAKEIWKSRATKGFEPVVKADDNDLPFLMVSVSTGHSASAIKASDREEWRNLHWIEPLLKDIFMRSVSENTNYVMQHLLPPYTNGTLRYHRIDPKLKSENSDMENTSAENISQLKAVAEDYINENEKQLLKLCEELRS